MKVAFRTDASLQIGTGHVMRSLALADVLRELGADVRFVCRSLAGNLIGCISRRGFEIDVLPAPEQRLPADSHGYALWAGVDWKDDVSETLAALNTFKPDWVVVDSYAFDWRWEKSIREVVQSVMVLDDLANRPHDCDVLVDQNLDRSKADYEGLVPPYCELLVGPLFALLRPEFAELRSESLRTRRHRELENILLSMGGVDPENFTGRIVRLLDESVLPESCKVTIILGEGAPWHEEVRHLCKSTRLETKVLHNVEDMAGLMLRADLAIGAGGSSTWERCCMGLPTILVTVAENQVPIARAMASWQSAYVADGLCAGSFRESFLDILANVVKVDAWSTLSERSANLCDGDGASRVCNHIIEPKIYFRDAVRADSRRIWEWRRFPGHEQFSKAGHSPAFPEHDDWFINALRDSNRELRILELGKMPCGYLRLDCGQHPIGSISICLSAEVKGRGLAKHLMREADCVAHKRGLKRIDAEIHVDNIPSINVFRAAGYTFRAQLNEFCQFEKYISQSETKK